MKKILSQKTGLVVGILGLVAAVIYALQIVIFRDARNTFFYIFQDLAFIPISIAITTVVVGSILDERSRRESKAKTRMLMGSFFSSIGAELMVLLLRASDKTLDVETARAVYYCDDPKEEHYEKIRQADFRIPVDRTLYDRIRELLQGWEIELMVLSSNPLLLEQESFTELLFGLFHLMDEFRLRGDYDHLDAADIAHFGDDFASVLRLLLLNSFENREHLRQAFPNFYKTASRRMQRMNLGGNGCPVCANAAGEEPIGTGDAGANPGENGENGKNGENAPIA